MTKKVEAFGIIKEGDRLALFTCLGKYYAHAKILINSGTDNEEVVIHKGQNHYFIVDRMLKGTSWVREAYIISKDHKEPWFKYYKKGNGIKNL